MYPGNINTQNAPLKRIQAEFYLNRLEEHGISSAWSVGWPDYLQILLFEKLMRIFSGNPENNSSSVLDVGCGLGDFFSYLKHHCYSLIRYHGIDIIPEMIQSGKIKYPDAALKAADFLSPAINTEYDYVVCSGAMNIIASKNAYSHEKYVLEFIKKMFRLSVRGCAFNLLAEEGREFFPEDGRFYYADRHRILEFCSRLSENIYMDYQDYDYIFTITMFK